MFYDDSHMTESSDCLTSFKLTRDSMNYEGNAVFGNPGDTLVISWKCHFEEGFKKIGKFGEKVK